MTKGTHPINQMDLGNSIEQHTDFSLGLTKREYFAAMAMQGLLANKFSPGSDYNVWAVEIADRVIEKLNEPNPNS